MTSLPNIQQGKLLKEVYTTPIPIHVPSPRNGQQIEGSSPRWRMQSKSRNETTGKCTIGKGLQVDNPSPAQRGKRVFSEQRGQEYKWRSVMAQVPPPIIKERQTGKRFVHPTPINDNPATGKMLLSGPATVSSEKLFQTRRTVRDGNGNPINYTQSDEFTSSMMTKKRISHTSLQKRNNVSLATLGDKAYAEPTYSSSYWVNAASTVPKCSVDKITQPAAPPPPSATRRSQEDISVVNSLPKIPKDSEWWDFLKKK